MGISDEQRERFESIARDLMRWLCESGHPHMTIIITPISAELLEGSIGIQSSEYVKD